MNAVAIIPVKSFAVAKSRLDIPVSARARVCEIMLREVLRATSSSGVSHTLVVSGDERAAKIAFEFGASIIKDVHESGVNDAIALTNGDALKFDTSIILPQDIPLVTPDDIDTALKMAPCPGALVIPSRKLDGTNALVRTPSTAFATHYDEDSHRIHLSSGRAAKLRTTLAFMRNIMLDVDTKDDLDYVMANSKNKDLSEQIRGAL